MSTLLTILTILVSLALIAVILLQRSEGGGLGIGGGQGAGSFMTGRGTATFLTRATGILAALFMLFCLLLAVLNKGASGGQNGHDLLAAPPAPAQASQPPVKTPSPLSPR
ncbi:preprotein translocase subunit SecG [Oecophyllibacter saccharovorans]|uniref:preprotein translocase subunit SecG n=1 Tax=Oecophyllibacter saccharovorans TaxID=2558360 RepID=UPI00116C9DD5|nr:preprotein translocase subunit SecG [Oecophyllibacter saccharovorans]TPW34616.1 preprotein translocase subunit SecG [Oecophyllibacter saccharovorans]